jgi:hypothetical protein
MPRTRKTTPVSCRTRKQTSARTLRNRGGNPATKKAVIKGLTSLLAPVICTAIGAALFRKEFQSLLMRKKPKPKPKPIVIVAEIWGVNSTSTLLTKEFWGESNFKNAVVHTRNTDNYYINFYNSDREKMNVYLVRGNKEPLYNDENNIYIVTEETDTQKLKTNLTVHPNDTVIHVVPK